MLRYLAIFIIVSTMNIVPFFMPATWTVLTFISIVYNVPFLPLSIVGAVAATLGRIILAKLSRVIVRQNFLSFKTKRNIDYLRNYVEEKHHVAFIFFLSYTFTPLPTNQLFIAYGLTDLKLRYLAVPFFVGRLASYLFLTFFANKVAEQFIPESMSSIFGTSFIIMQLISIGVVYLFTKINWKHLLKRKRVELIS